MSQYIYLDNSATTMPCESSITAVNKCLTVSWANPSSTHSKGIDALIELTNAREVVSKSINCKSDEIIFTSCGTEANNLAILGVANALKRYGNRIVTTEIEHPSVLKCVEFLSNNGFEIIKISPNTNGKVSPEKIAEAVNGNTILVSVMLVNNELGSVQNISQISKLIKQKNSKVLFHCDAVQAYGKLAINTKDLGVDLLSASGHKIHAPKGIGFLYKKKSVNITPIIHGGGQEFSLRSGTESLPLICGLAAAVNESKNIKEQYNNAKEIFEYCFEKLNDTGLVEINSPSDALPYILNFSVTGYKAEPLLNALSIKGIYVSKGSACAKGQRSYVLSACGFDNDRIDSALRLSFSRFTTKEEIDIFIEALLDITKTLRRFK